VTRSLSELDVPEKVPDKTFDHEWIRHLIDLALVRLGRAHQQYHQVLSRFLLEDSSYAEIGRALGITETTVKNRVYRGKQKLSQLLRDDSLSWDQYAQELEYLAAALGSGRQNLQEAATVALGS
jgi:DNA-directed RNA polymerase specialized sigma24 family protein